MDPHEYLDQVKDAETFLVFARALTADNRTSDEWQNTTIEHFLESAIAWAESTKFGVTQGVSPTNLWQQFAVFLYCGKIYE